MALNIKNPRVLQLAAELAAMTGDNKTEAIRKGLEDRKNRLIVETSRLARRIELEKVMAGKVGKARIAVKPNAILSCAEVHELLSYGPLTR